MKRLLLFIYVCSVCAVLYVQGQTVLPTKEQSQQDLQAVQEDFFDPLRKDAGEAYRFHVEYRIEAGYVQNNHRSGNKTYENLFMHGFRAGVTFDFMLPLRFSLQTGVLNTFTYGSTYQHWMPMNWEDYTTPDPATGKAHSGDIKHRLYEYQLSVPVRMYYNVRLWKKLNMFFYTGPQLQIGVLLKDDMAADVSEQTKQWMRSVGQQYEPYDRYKEKELDRLCVQWGLGGGFEWDRYRLQAGYDFGLNNMMRNKLVADQQMQEWHWFVSFCYKIK